MYLSHYKLKCKPFDITTDPTFLWLGEKHKEALSTLEYGIREDKGFLLLTGDVGTGKTVLVNTLVKKIKLKSIITTVPDPGLDMIDFFNFLAVSFRFGRGIQTKGEFLGLLKKFLIKSEAVKRKVLLLIDEAQRLNHSLLEEIRLLSNIEMDSRKLINIFFVGQPEFNQILMEKRNRAVRNRIDIRYHIEALNRKEVASYIRHRLQVAGTTAPIFTPAAVEGIYAHTKGNPRLINIICDRALLAGFSKGRKMIDADVIKESVSAHRLPEETARFVIGKYQPPSPVAVAKSHRKIPKRFSLSTVLLAALMAGIVVAAGYYLFDRMPQSKAPWSPDDLVPPRPAEQVDMTSEPLANIPAATNESSVPPNLTGTRPPADLEEVLAAQPEPAAVKTQNVFDPEKMQKIMIRFDFNSNELPDMAYHLMDQIAESLLQYPHIHITLTGYTDDRGSAGYNRSMSEFRANIIKTYLAGKGVEPSRITSLGRGSENPIASNETAQGRSINRRVEIEFNKRPSG